MLWEVWKECNRQIKKNELMGTYIIWNKIKMDIMETILIVQWSAQDWDCTP